MSHIKLFQLVTGENVIGEVDEGFFSNEAQINFINPLFVVAQQTEDRKSVTIQLMPYSNLAEGNTIKVNFKNIVWVADPEQKLLNQYQSIFSKIITPPEPQVTS
jgi:hypothetical protein